MNLKKVLGFAMFGLFGFSAFLAFIQKLINIKGFFDMFQNFGVFFEIILIWVLDLCLIIGVAVLAVLGILRALKDDHSKLRPFATYTLLAFGGVMFLSWLLAKISVSRNGGGFGLGGREVLNLILMVLVIAGGVIALLMKDKIALIGGLVAAVSLFVLEILALIDTGGVLPIIITLCFMLGAGAAGAVYALPLLGKE